MSELTIILHGLGENAFRMSLVDIALKQASYRTANIDYPSTRFDCATLLEKYVAPLFKKYAAEPRVNFVTHSLGGTLLHCALKRYDMPNLGRVAMLAPGHHGSEFFTYARYNPVNAILLGPALQQSAADEDCFTNPFSKEADYEVGIIAGSLSLDPIANMIMPWPHDGRVSVQSTKLLNMKDHIVLPVAHESIKTDPIAIYQAINFLKTGRFLHNPYHAFVKAA